MSTVDQTITDLDQYTRDVAERARAASRELALATTAKKIEWLKRTAELIRARTEELLAANAVDLENAPGFGLNSAAVDRLRLSDERLEAIAQAVEHIATLPDPVGEVIDESTRPNGLELKRVRVPLGVVFFIYESRPNVTVDAAALCAMSGNAIILRGGKEAFHSNHAFHSILADALKDVGLPGDAVQLVQTTDRAAVGKFLKLNELIDVTIPRGGRSLIERVSSEATMPVIKHFDGICHVYVDSHADLDMAESIVINSKCQRPGVCNAAECLLVHTDVAADFIPRIGAALAENGVEIRGCPRTCELIHDAKPATDGDYATEYLELIISLRVVDSLREATDHIDQFSSAHTESIVTADDQAAAEFTARVDSSAVFVNASTRFNDGGEFGLGAEIGISTDRFHARGPCGLREMTTYKYIGQGTGQIR